MYQTGPSVAFYIGPIPFYWYGMFVLFGFLAAALVAYVEWVKKGKRTWDFVNIFFIGIFIVLYGARLWYIIFNPVESFQNVDSFLEVVMVFLSVSSGRSILGTIVFSTLLCYLYSKWISPDLDWRETFSIILPSMFIAQAIGRWGNFANHSVYGNVVDPDQISFLPTFILDNMYIDGYYRQPLFLYESMADMIGYLLIFLVFKTNDYFKEGVAGATYIFLYGIIRTIMEPLRDSQFQMSWGSFETSLATSIIFIFGGFSMMVYLQFYYVENKTYFN